MSNIQPKTVLDIGVGWGTFGVICREKTDAVNGRWRPKEWQTLIIGVEVWEEYTRLPHVKQIYNQVYPINVVDFVRNYDKLLGDGPLPDTWDLIHAGDVIEHVVKDEGREVMEWMVGHCKNLILQVPLGDAWAEHDPKWENSWEAHKAAWYLHDFSGWYDAINIPTHSGAVLCAWWRFE